MVELALLGPFEAHVDGMPLVDFGYAKVRALLAYLAVERTHPHSRAHLALLLWPDASEQQQRQNLSQALSTLRALLRAAGTPLLRVTSTTIQLDPRADCVVDVARFRGLLAEVDTHAHHAIVVCAPCIARLQAAAGLYRGDFLAQFPAVGSEVFDEWAQHTGEHLRQLATSAFERLLYASLWHEQPAEAAAHAGRVQALAACAVETLPVAKPIHHANQQCAGDKLLPAATDPVVAAWHSDVEAVCATLGAGTTRMLTIIGAPGSDPWRLALLAGDRLRYTFADGVVLVDLAAANTPSHVLAAIGQALARPASEAPLPYLRARHMLLIVCSIADVSATAAVLATLLEACPHVHVLAASAVPLRLRAEQRMYQMVAPKP